MVFSNVSSVRNKFIFFFLPTELLKQEHGEYTWLAMGKNMVINLL